jgi:hypothetical protein
VTALAVLLLIFVPKMMAICFDRIIALEEIKQIAHNNLSAHSELKEEEHVGDNRDNVQPVAAPQTTVAGQVVATECGDAQHESKEIALSKPAAVSADATEKSAELSQTADGKHIESPEKMMQVRETSKASPGSSFRSSGRRQFGSVTSSTSAEGSSELGAMKVIRNPRSPQDLQAANTGELTRRQLEFLEGIDDSDDYDEGKQGDGGDPEEYGEKEQAKVDERPDTANPQIPQDAGK